MRIDKFLSLYMSAEKIPAEERKFTIAAVKAEKVGPEQEQKAVVYFAEAEQGLVLNKTNASVLDEAYGNETEDWIGKPVVMFRGQTKFGGKTVPAIRLKVVK